MMLLCVTHKHRGNAHSPASWFDCFSDERGSFNPPQQQVTCASGAQPRDIDIKRCRFGQKKARLLKQGDQTGIIGHRLPDLISQGSEKPIIGN